MMEMKHSGQGGGEAREGWAWLPLGWDETQMVWSQAAEWTGRFIVRKTGSACRAWKAGQLNTVMEGREAGHEAGELSKGWIM